ncbi:hypothetical protein yc1106_04398 [Curvularia clavata]|uniref:Uncharacterized protein n=1 Tax=Curvularia clavata TaxID=95742 RepID=A0A9Q9DSU7_CURCL|nr:hypothetical protein yc1106_04398 [Curvularia clavata]
MAQDPVSAKDNNTMQLAEILSDLVSLRVCDPAAALALVSARSDSSSTTTTATTSAAAAADADPKDDSDLDLKRAKDLLKLHIEVKEAEKRGELSRVLEEARGLVERAVGG